MKGNSLEFPDVLQADQALGGGDAILHQAEEVGAAGQRKGFALRTGEQPDRFLG